MQNPWKNVSRTSVIGWYILVILLLLPFQFAIIYYFAYNGSIIAIAISLLQIYYQYISSYSKKMFFVNFMRSLKLDKYFKEFNIHFESPIQNSKAMFAFHPHCIFTIGLILNHYNSKFGDTVVLATRALLLLPGIGLLHQFCGIQSCDKNNIQKLMKNNQNVALIPGGFEEATLTSQKEQRVYIKKRKGFIKYALQYGYTVYPCFTFGENKMYHTVEKGLKYRLLLNKIKCLGAFFWSRFGLMIPEHNIKIDTVIGKGIIFEKCEKPSEEEVNKAHEKYIQCLKNLYYEKRESFGEKSELFIY